MTFSREIGLLSNRLRAIRDFYQEEKNIWDIGCDHGLLGLSFLNSKSVESINLVDPSAEVIDVLKKKIEDSYITNPLLFLHHKKGQEIKIEKASNIFFIAGMGGKEVGEIIENLLPQIDENSKFVISPHRKILELRSLLGSLPIELLKEDLIYENDQYYQLLSLRPRVNGMRVSSFGDVSFWHSGPAKAYRIQQMKSFSHHKDKLSMEYVEFLKNLNI